MAWPDDAPLPVFVYVAPGADLTDDPATWPWVDVTADVALDDEITIEAGRKDWGEHDDGGSCSVTFLNASGRYSQHNPLGQWYGLLGKDTPLRVDIDPPGAGAPVTVFGGYVPSWQPSTDLTGKDRKVAVTARGPMYRLQPGQAKPPARSPLRRFLAASGPAAYWPLEDGANAQMAASGLPGGRPLALAGVVEFESGGPVGSAGFAKIAEAAGNRLSGPTGVQGVALPAWQSGVWVKGKQTSTAQNEFPPLTVFTDAAGAFAWSLVLGNGNPAGGGTGRVASVVVSDTASSVVGQVDLNGPPSLLDERWHLLQMVATMVAGIDGVVDLYVDGTLVGSDTMTGVNVGNPIAVRVPATTTVADTEETGVAHVSVHTFGTVLTQWETGQGSVGEAAASRLFTLCDEEGVPIEIDSGSGELMGPVPVATLLDLLREIEATDGGILHERAFTLAYRPRVTLYNQDPALTLDLAVGAQELADTPVPDASGQRYRNRWTVKREGGSSATAETPGVTAGAELPYEGSADANTATDDRLADHAGWRLHLTSSGDPDWPALTLRLDEAPHLLDAWLATGLGDRITAGPPPEDLAGRDIDVLLQGYTLRLGHREFEVKANCSPARPWAVGEWDDARYDTMGSSLVAGVAAGVTSLSVATSLGPLWTTAAGEMPFDVMVAGERMTVTAISGASSPQTFTVTRAVNGVSKAQAAGADVRLADPSVWAL